MKMTVQDLIDQLMNVKDKSKLVYEEGFDDCPIRITVKELKDHAEIDIDEDWINNK